MSELPLSPISEDTPFAGLPRLADDEFDGFRALVKEVTGISLGPEKRSLLSGRLAKRLRALGLPSYAAYREYLDSNHDAREWICFADVVTTNKTDFFREPHHFQFLGGAWLEERKRAAEQGAARKLRVWSAACSSGEEPYTAAFALLDALGREARAWDVRILATDLCTRVLERAQQGIYSRERVQDLPAELLRRHFLRGTSTNDGFVRVRAEIRAAITFRRLNFVDDAWPIRMRFQAIFCRNALIYFDRATQEQIVRRLIAYLEPGGHLMLGHSECIHGWIAELEHIGNTIYRLRPTAP